MPVTYRIEGRSVAEMRATTNWFIERAGPLPHACAFVTRPGLQYGLMRMISAWLELKSFKSYVTTELEDGVRWLNALGPHAASRH